VKLEDARYFNLATFRKNGAAVETPVWFAPSGDSFYVFSAGNAGKVKRIRANGRARVAPCDVSGRLLGEWHDASARLLSDRAEVDRAYSALRSRYGWQMWITDALAMLSGRYHKRALIAVELGR
jgi:PPOX class probable F420-dependent enzyme